jgi:glycosyltransferase involved in cell wall biosynthesis
MLVPAGDVRALAQAIEQVASDPELRARLARGSRQLAQHFDWHNIATMHLSLYRLQTKQA